MSGRIILGTQWGDEGKGKICDLVAADVDMVVRFQGGNNAGHTVIVGDTVLKLHHIPSGIMHPHVKCIIGDGMLVNPRIILEEMDLLESQGISTDNILISSNAHLIMPYHLILDREGEMRLGGAKIGTTRKGIGPAYADKAKRIGIRVQDLQDPKIFKKKVISALEEKNETLTKIYNVDPMKATAIVDEYEEYTKRIESYIADTSLIISQTLNEGKNVLFEGAQGTLLDIDHGTYPFVTSSSSTAGGACTGSGIGPHMIDEITGVVKAYLTRVGSGPFPSEEEGEIGETMREIGQEYGTTTGRPRRCGWLDTVLLKYAVRINGLDGLALTKLDVLKDFDKIKICVKYEHNGQMYEEFPPHQSIFHKVKPIYEELPGWKSDISKARRFEDLPGECQRYIKRIEEIGNVPFKFISVGADRKQTIIR